MKGDLVGVVVVVAVVDEQTGYKTDSNDGSMAANGQAVGAGRE